MLQVLLSVLNQECCAPLSEDPLNEVKGKSTQSVSVGHHNLAYAASLCFTQKGTQPFPLKVDTGSDCTCPCDDSPVDKSYVWHTTPWQPTPPDAATL